MSHQESWTPEPEPNPWVSHPIPPHAAGMAEPPNDQLQPIPGRWREPSHHNFPLPAPPTGQGIRTPGRVPPQSPAEFSIVAGISAAFDQVREHLIEWVVFTFATTGIAVGILLVSLTFEPPAAIVTGAGTTDPRTPVIGSVTFEIWLLLVQAMALSAAVRMINGYRVGTLGFLRVQNFLCVLPLILVFGTAAGLIRTGFGYGHVPSTLITLTIALPMVFAIAGGAGPLRALVCGVALLAEHPAQTIKLVLVTVLLGAALRFIPVLGGSLATATVALMLAYGYRELVGRASGGEA